MESFVEGLKICPNSFDLRLAMMDALKPRWGGSHSLMEDLAREALEHADTNPKLRLLMGFVFVDQGEMLSYNDRPLTEVLPYFDRAVALAEYGFFYRKRAQEFFSRGIYESALSDVEHAIQLSSRTVENLAFRANILLRLKKYEDAVSDVTEALQIDPEHDGTHYALVELRLRQKDLKKAWEDLQVWMRVQSDPIAFRSMRNWAAQQAEQIGYDLAAQNDFIGAMEAFDYGIQFDSTYAQNYMRQGFEFHREGENEKAESALQTAIALDSGEFYAYRELHEVLAASKRWNEIIDSWRRYLAVQPEDSRAWMWLGTAAHRGGQMGIWRECIDHLQNLAPDLAEGLQLETMSNGSSAGEREGILEAEDMEILEKRVRGVSVQDMESWGRDRWSGGRQLFVKPGEDGHVDLRLSVSESAYYDLAFYGTKASDYGIVQFSVDDRQIGAPVDLYAAGVVVPTGKIVLGKINLSAGNHVLTIRTAGKNDRSPRRFFGVDCFELARIR